MNNQKFLIDVSRTDLHVRQVSIDDRTPTGAQIAAAAGFAPSKQVTILHWQSDGVFEDVRPDETVDLEKGLRFIVQESDGSYRITIDGRRIDWPVRDISGALLRQLARVPDTHTIYFERRNEPDQQLADGEVLDLAAQGVESFYSRQGSWILNVQGVRLEFDTPTVLTSVAIQRAGFDVTQGWHIFLKIAGEPKKEVALNDVIDLRTPGIEKLRLTPKDVNNGEMAARQRYEFQLLEVDESFLDERFARWETILDNGHRWLLIHGYRPPVGYLQSIVTLALEIPPAYPGAQIDMFYVTPALNAHGMQPLPNTELCVQIGSEQYQRWSRHRGEGSPWRPESDNVITHLALVESALTKEVAL